MQSPQMSSNPQKIYIPKNNQNPNQKPATARNQVKVKKLQRFNFRTIVEQTKKEESIQNSPRVQLQPNADIMTQYITENKALKLNQYQNEKLITLLKTKLLQLQEENMSLCDKFLTIKEDNTTSQIKEQDRFNLLFIIQSLKKEIKRLNQDNNSITINLEQIKKQNLFTNNQELKIENTALKNHLIKLQKLTKSNVNCEQCQNFINQYNDLQKSYKTLKYEHVKLKNSNYDTVKQISQYQFEEQKENHFLEKLMVQSKLWSDNLQKVNKVQAQYKKSKEYSDDLIEQLNNRINEIKSLQKQLTHYQKVEKERDELKREINLLQTHCDKVSKSNQDLLMQIKAKKNQRRTQTLNLENEIKFRVNPQPSNIQVEKVSEVKFDDIKTIVLKLICHLKQQKITQDSAIQLLVLYDSTIDIEQLMDRLKETPFDVEDHIECQLLARYLVETDSNSSQFNLDINLECSTRIVTSVFKKILDDYTIFQNQIFHDTSHMLQNKILSQKENIVMFLKKHFHQFGNKTCYLDMLAFFEKENCFIFYLDNKSVLEIFMQHIFVISNGEIETFNLNEFFEHWQNIVFILFRIVLERISYRKNKK